MSFKLILDGGPGDGGGAGDAGDASTTMASIDMAGFNIAGSPVVTIKSPTAATVVQGDTLNVIATVTSPTNTVIQSSSVLLTITPPGGAILSTPLSLSGAANTYAGSISVAGFPSGTAGFTVSATDILGLKGSATGTYIHDHGPVITFLQPTAATAHGSVTVELMVDDTLHPVTDPTKVSAYIRAPGDIVLTEEPNTTPIRLTATIDFSKFTPPLDGTQIINATATNSNNTTTHASKQFIVDNAGPIISLTAPLPGGFVGGVVEVIATITDESGVSDSTVLAVFGNDPTHNAVPLTRTTVGSDTFHGFFDVRSLGRNFVLPELSITAADTLGNSSQLGVEIVVDNTPPEMTMDASLRVYVSELASGVVECSQPFSPLGPYVFGPPQVEPEVAFNGAIMKQEIGLRARIEDRGNTAPGLLLERFSGLIPQSVFLYAIHDDGMTPLAVDTDGDTNHYCDNVNPALIPSTSALSAGQALSLALVPMNLGGGADFVQFNVGTPTPIGRCDVYGDATSKPPQPLCLKANTQTTFVLPYNDPHIASPIFTIPPVTTQADGCVGFQLDAANTLPEGPTCVVTVATDQAGNTNVTAPLHICVDLGNHLCDSWNISTPPTTCTGVWDKTQMKIVPGTCTPEPTFQDGEVRYLPAFQ